jgi:hypothetical protein
LGARASGVRSQDRSATTMARRGPGIHAGGESGRGGSEPTPCRGQRLHNRVPRIAASCPRVWRILACCSGRFARRREVPKGVHRRRERRPGGGARPENRVVCLRGDLRDTEHAGARRASWRAPQISAIFCFKRIRGQQKIPSGSLAGEGRRSGRTINKQSGPDMTFGQPIKDWVVRI